MSFLWFTQYPLGVQGIAAISLWFEKLFCTTPINLFNLTLEMISNSRESQRSRQILIKFIIVVYSKKFSSCLSKDDLNNFCKSEDKDVVFNVIR